MFCAFYRCTQGQLTLFHLNFSEGCADPGIEVNSEEPERVLYLLSPYTDDRVRIPMKSAALPFQGQLTAAWIHMTKGHSHTM